MTGTEEESRPTRIFNEHHPRLHAVAYRMLGRFRANSASASVLN